MKNDAFPDHSSSSELEDNSCIPFKSGLGDNLETIQVELGYSSDLSIREFKLGSAAVPAAILWINSMNDAHSLDQNVIAPLLERGSRMEIVPTADGIYEQLCDSVIFSGEVALAESVDSVLTRLLSGASVLLVDGMTKGVTIGNTGYETRSIQEPSSTSVVRGPRDGFVESLSVNVSLIRRRIRDKRLHVEVMTVGSVSHTQIALLYLRHRAPKQVVEEVRERLKRIQIDAVLESNYIEEIIKDAPRSIFPTVYISERPDDIAGGALEGRVVVIVDGSPFVLLLPCTFFHLMQTAEDYYLAFPIAAFVRWLRLIGLYITLLFPALYVGILSFHPEMVPPELLSSILAAREGVPFPLLIEALLMELTFEGLREAGVRMPRAIGSAISIVGALVIGESAVSAGIISPPTIIVVAGTAIASFIIPSVELSGAVRLLRFFMLLFASILGLYGIVLGMMLLGIHLTTIKSVGTPYLAPIAPFKSKEALKTVFRLPWWIVRTKKN
ncbi:spore germination protein [Paenibacillus arenilitoris]|uniref:Spore germination protein n=1 Tax=Paenibacillus arenilitoris TaxID=2772299 RepID=A0A927CQM4_9BACL|nr:spore germination protein [Paenibacillus arenilitoris]MBD2869860.1 spore germination protein [Paenibacillus arenilitoris]